MDAYVFPAWANAMLVCAEPEMLNLMAQDVLSFGTQTESSARIYMQTMGIISNVQPILSLTDIDSTLDCYCQAFF